MIAKHIKLSFKLLIRRINDIVFGYSKKYAKNYNYEVNGKFKYRLSQEINTSEFYENKIINIQLATNKIKKVTVHPQQIFSFWRIVGKPSWGNGFKEGRNIIKGKVQKDFGGGLCQLSGILYHLCLLTKLEIIERHNHSIDIYNEPSRFTPLGADATVVYGYKDLRFINPFNFPITFDFLLEDNQLTAILISPKEIPLEKIHFTKKEMQSTIEVQTTNGQGKVMAQSEYKKPTKETPKAISAKPTVPSILTNLFSGTFILFGTFYVLFTGLFDFIFYSFQESILAFFMGLGLTLLTILFIGGSLINIKEGLNKIQRRQNSKEPTNIKPFYWALFLGLLPIVFSLCFGMIDFYIVPINELMLLPMLIVVFSPFIFAKRFKLSILEVFYGILFWGILVVVGIYFFK